MDIFGCSFMFGRRKENTKRYCSVNHRRMGPTCRSPNPLLPPSSAAGVRSPPAPPFLPAAAGLAASPRAWPPAELRLRAELRPLRLREQRLCEGRGAARRAAARHAEERLGPVSGGTVRGGAARPGERRHARRAAVWPVEGWQRGGGARRAGEREA